MSFPITLPAGSRCALQDFIAYLDRHPNLISSIDLIGGVDPLLHAYEHCQL
jgi:hypothetical protein